MLKDAKQHAMHVRQHSSSLDKQMLHVHMSMASTSLSSVLFTSRPITAALSKPVFQVWMLCLSLFWVSGIRGCLNTLDGAKISRRSWNFTAVEFNLLPHHNRSNHIQSSGVGRIDLLTDSQVVPVQVQEVGSSIMLKVDGESAPLVDGWCLTTREDHVRPDAVKFLLLASDDGVEWKQVGSSTSFLDSFGNVRHTNGRFETSAQRNQTVCFSFAKDHFWVRCLLVDAVIVAALYWIGVGFAVAARENTCRIIVGRAQLLSAITMMGVATAGVTHEGFEAGSDLIIAASCVLVCAYCFLVDEGAVRICITIASCIGMGMAFAHLIYFHNVILFVFTLVMNVGTFSFFKEISRRRHRHLSESLALVKDDTIAYDAAWASLFQRCPNAISKLQHLVDSTWQSKVTNSVRQYRPAISRRWSPGEGMVLARPASTDRDQPSLPTLFRRPHSMGDPSPSTAHARVLADVLLATKQLGAVSPVPSRILSAEDALMGSAPCLVKFGGLGLSAGRNMAASGIAMDFPEKYDSSSLGSSSSSSSSVMAGACGAQKMLGKDVSSSGPRREVSSLDELYEAARAAEPVLLSKVQEWAASTEGCFHRRKAADTVTGHGTESGDPHPLNQFVKWRRTASKMQEDEEQPEPEPEQQMRWAQLKSPSRAVQKVYSAYGGDVSHLTDICRQSIVFTDLNHLAACLAAILGDPDVAVERIKNRYCPSYDSSVSAGYRDVALNVRLIGGRAQCLVAPELRASVASHVCEVQLILAEFASLKSDRGHAQYVRFRDLRGQ